MARTENPAISQRETGPGEAPALVMLHGVMGSRQNLLPLARCLGEARRCYLLDLPGHGNSDWLPAYGYETLVRQLLDWADAQELQQFDLLGHSLGGRLAMGMALTSPARIRSLQVLDITPLPSGDDSHAVLQAMAAVDLSALESRQQVDNVLAESIPVPGVRQFAMTNLQRTKDGMLSWRLDLDGLLAAWEVWQRWPWTNAVAPDLRTQLVYGANTAYVDAAGIAACQAAFPALKACKIDAAGHWLHAEQPHAVCRVVRDFLVS